MLSMAENDSLKDSIFHPAAVECHSGYKACERPLAFTCQGRRREILEILDRWYEGGLAADKPVVNYFKVKTGQGRVFILRYTAESDAWSVRRMDPLTMEDKQ
jgi:hypothetical protein